MANIVGVTGSSPRRLCALTSRASFLASSRVTLLTASKAASRIASWKGWTDVDSRKPHFHVASAQWPDCCFTYACREEFLKRCEEDNDRRGIGTNQSLATYGWWPCGYGDPRDANGGR